MISSRTPFIIVRYEFCIIWQCYCIFVGSKNSMMTKIEREKRMVELMIRLYCQKKEGNSELCRNCQSLRDYALRKLDNCRYGDKKGACKKCSTHCYAPKYRDAIRQVMRYSGPRMIFYQPWETVRHWINR